MARKSFEQVVEFIKSFSSSHLQIKKVGFDFDSEMGNVLTKDERYPAVFIAPKPWTLEHFAESGSTFSRIELDIYCLDVIQKDRANVTHILSDTALFLQDLFIYLSDDDQEDFETAISGLIEPVNNSQLDYLGGNMMTITVIVEGYGSCEIPIGTPTVPGIVCEPVAYSIINELSEIIESGTANSGTTLQVTVTDSNVRNSDSSYSVQVAATSNLVLPDTPVNLINTDLDDLGTTNFPSVTGGQITAPDGSLRVQKSNGNEISTPIIPSGKNLQFSVNDSNVSNSDDSYSVNVLATENLELPDSNISNSDDSFSIDIPATTDYELPDVTHTDSDGSSVVLPAITPMVCTPAGTGIGAKPIKTGQTTSYRTGDTGDYERGSGNANFILLSSNNPFGNNRKFTGTTGGYKVGVNYFDNNGSPTTEALAFPNGVVLVWSTYDQSTVMGIPRNLATFGNTSWNDAVDNCEGLSLDGYTDWAIINRSEIIHTTHCEISTGVWNFDPFNLTGVTFWTGDTMPGNTVVAITHTSAIFSIGVKTDASGRGLPIRFYTNAELGI